MISVEGAAALIMERARSFGSEIVPVTKAMGRILSESLFADRDFPPYDRVTMDGIAIMFGTWSGGVRSFPVQETSAAGDRRARLRDPSHCIEIMTGGILPEGCDTVIRYEDLELSDGNARILTDDVQLGKNIHHRGTDRKAGDVIVKSGSPIAGPEIGIATTVGKSILHVAALPKVAIVSTGDELVDITGIPLPHQIRKSNVYQIGAMLHRRGVYTEAFHLADHPGEVMEALQELLARFDCLVISGGVSAGKFDYVPDALDKLGVQKIFHKVAQRPGKPFWFGSMNARQVVFALPGNPVSAFMCTIRYILPWLDASLGLHRKPMYAVLTEDFHFPPSLTCFLQVRLHCREDGTCLATPAEGHGSGDLANLVDADGFLELPREKEHFRAGEAYMLWRYR